MADSPLPDGTAPAGDFVLVTLDGEAFAPTATLRFGPGEVISGIGPCNRWSARLAAPWPAFRPGPVTSTERACPDLRAENDFFLSLSIMTEARLDGDTLTLSSAQGITMVFRAAP